MMMINPNKKAKIAKRWVSIIVALAFLFNTCCPAWALRDGNFGEKNSLLLFGSGALAGAVTAVGCIINPVAGAVSSGVSDVAGLVMYYAMYHDFGKPMSIFGWETPFSKGQFYSMVAGIIAGAVAGLLQGALEEGGKELGEDLAGDLTEGATEGAVKSGVEEGVKAGAQAVITEVPKTAIQKIVDAIVKALKWLWDHTIGWLWEKLKSIAKGIIKFIKNPIKTMKEWIKNLRAKPVANPYYRFGASGRYDMALVQLTGDIAIGTIRLTVSELVSQELEEAGWDATIAAIVGNLTATYVGTFVTPIIMGGVGAPFGWKNIDNLGGLLTEEEYAKLKSIYDQHKALQNMQEITVTYTDSGETKTEILSTSILRSAQEGEINILTLEVNGQSIPVTNGMINMGTFSIHINHLAEVVKSYADAYRTSLTQNQNLLAMTGGLMTDIHGNPLSRNVFSAGLKAAQNLGLGPAVSATSRVLILKALGYHTHYGRDNDRIFENLWKMALANAAGNTASRLITNINEINSAYAGLTYQTTGIDGAPKTKYRNPWQTRGSLPLGKYMLQVITQEAGFAASQIGWGYFCKANDIKPGAVYELVHLAGTSFAAGLIDAFARRDPGPQGAEGYGDGDQVLEGRLGWTDIDKFGAGVAGDIYHQFREAAIDSVLLYYPYRSSGFGLNALQARWHAQDRIIYHISSIARGANPIQARAMALAGNMNYRANLNFAESFSAAITNPILPRGYRSYAAFNYGSIDDYRVDEVVINPLIDLLRKFSAEYPEVIEKMSPRDRKRITKAIDKGTLPNADILRSYAEALSEVSAGDGDRLMARIEIAENPIPVFEAYKRFGLDPKSGDFQQLLQLLASLEIATLTQVKVTRTYYRSRAGVPMDRVVYGNVLLADRQFGGLRNRLGVDLSPEAGQGSDVIQTIRENQNLSWLLSGPQDTNAEIEKLLLQLQEEIYLFSGPVLLRRTKIDRFNRLEKTEEFGLDYSDLDWLVAPGGGPFGGMLTPTFGWSHVKRDIETEHIYGPFGHALSVTEDRTYLKDDAEWPTSGANIYYGFTLYPTGEGQSPYAGPSHRIDIADMRSGPQLIAEGHYRVPSFRLLLSARAREEKKEELSRTKDADPISRIFSEGGGLIDLTEEQRQELEKRLAQSEEVKTAEQQGKEIDAYLSSPLGRIQDIRISRYEEFEGKISGGELPDWIAIPTLRITVGYDSDSAQTVRFGHIQPYTEDREQIIEKIEEAITNFRDSEHPQDRQYAQALESVLIHHVGDRTFVSEGEEDPFYHTFYSFANDINLSKYKHLLDSYGLRESYYYDGAGRDPFIAKDKLRDAQITTIRAYTEPTTTGSPLVVPAVDLPPKPPKTETLTNLQNRQEALETILERLVSGTAPTPFADTPRLSPEGEYMPMGELTPEERQYWIEKVQDELYKVESEIEAINVNDKALLNAVDSTVVKGTEVGTGSVTEEVIATSSEELRIDPSYLPPVQDLLSSSPESTVSRSLDVANEDVTEVKEESITLPEPAIDSTYLSTLLDSFPEVMAVNKDLEVASNEVIKEGVDYIALPEPQTINIETAVMPLPISERELEMINAVLDLEIDTKPEETRSYDIRRIVPLEYYSELPEAVANDYMGRFIAKELGYQFVSIPAGLAGSDYFKTAIETVRKEHPDAVIVELHHDSQGGSNKTRLFTAHQSGESGEGDALYTTRVHSTDRQSPVEWAPEHLPSQFITHENTGVIEFTRLSGLLRLSPEQIQERVNEVQVMIERKFGDRPVVIIPGHGGVNYPTSHYIRSSSGLPSTGTTTIAITPMPGAGSPMSGVDYQHK